MSSTATETIELHALAVATDVGPGKGLHSIADDSPRLIVGAGERSRRSTDESVYVDGTHPGQGNGKSLLRISLAIGQPSLVNFAVSFTNGIITVALPAISRSINLPRELFLWPSSVYGLTSGAALLLAGSIADLVGAKSVELVGVGILAIFALASGLAQTGQQLVAFRALMGIGMVGESLIFSPLCPPVRVLIDECNLHLQAMHLPSSVSLVAAAVPRGRARNVGFAFLGLTQPLGFSLGLILAGVLLQSSDEGWRKAFFTSGSLTAIAAMGGYWVLPSVEAAATGSSIWSKLKAEVDWVGVGLSSAGLSLFAYVLAMLSADLSVIRTGTTATLLALSLMLIVSFPFWMSYRTRHGKVALIPNSLWQNIPFTSICLLVTLSWGALNSIELFSSLYFQEIQHHSSLTTSLLLLPMILVGTLANFSTGVFVDRLPARWLIAISSLLTAGTPLIMALVDPNLNYWYLQFWAQVLAPLSADILFTVGLIVVSESFPEQTQALAGAVFNTVAQLGLSLGMGVCQVVALGVSATGGGAGHGGSGSQDAGIQTDVASLLRGYRASFWTIFGYMIICTAVAVVGLRNVGKVGVKRD
ncbi:hypothetical protein PgNI_06352 [Pyricularia grisea]|uniref:Major facilitator superfamily (MFS) profile domain-containing protein n=1 Tax=Pyricularia grisea TaxID=148305 RepID=A0A6P8B7C2_PYRGI|nr:hypothetical protein PgNI_06352 [Pyricularia grisea]TLD11143.1 hypothetical protein PgNI_06352 [Pyricularia grisea]